MTVTRPSPQTPATEASWIAASEKTQTDPIWFQGNPVSTQERSHSQKIQAAARATTRLGPRQPLTCTRRAARPMKSAWPAASAPTASGMKTPKRSASTRKAWPTQ